MKIKYYFVDNLSLESLIKLQILLKSKKECNSKICLYYFEISRFAYIFYKTLKVLMPISIIRFNFAFENILDNEKSVYGFKKIFEDSTQIFDTILKNKEYFRNQTRSQINFTNYFKKQLALKWPCYGKEISFNKILLMFHAANHHANTNLGKNIIKFFIEKKPWIKELKLFASNLGIELIEVKPIFGFSRSKLKSHLLKRKYPRIILYNLQNIINFIVSYAHNYQLKKNNSSIKNLSFKDPKIIVDQMMQYFGSSTFWKSSTLPPKDIIFAAKFYKVNQQELNEIKNCGMEYIALTKSVSKGIDALLYSPKYNVGLKNFNFSNSNLSWESKIIAQQKNNFFAEKSYWIDLFKTFGAKIYASHDKWGFSPIVAAEAIGELGGISALWQTSFYETMGITINADIYFTFSTKNLQTEKRNSSSINKIVGVGYPFDFNFSSAKIKGSKVRKLLKNNNAQKILSIFDGSAAEDERWSVGKFNFQKDYQFILQKVLKEDWLGLIIKSKKPGSLRKNLGDASELLDNAISTGRCFFSEDTDYVDKNLSIRPAEAAYASDIAIHFCLYAGTAGLEAALTGTPTLLLDHYNLKYSQFYKMDKEKVVFQEFADLWDELKTHWRKKPISNFGNWSNIIDDIEPFRDGKAAHRINSFLNSLLEGFKAGFDREKNIEIAVEKYCNKWGSENVISFS